MQSPVLYGQKPQIFFCTTESVTLRCFFFFFGPERVDDGGDLCIERSGCFLFFPAQVVDMERCCCCCWVGRRVGWAGCWAFGRSIEEVGLGRWSDWLSLGFRLRGRERTSKEIEARVDFLEHFVFQNR